MDVDEHVKDIDNLRRAAYASAGLPVTEPTSRARIKQIEDICRQLDIDTFSCRAYANCVAVSISAWVEDDISRGSLIPRDYLVTIDHKDTLQDASSMIAKTAGIDVKRTIKQEHRPSDETMRKFLGSIERNPVADAQHLEWSFPQRKNPDGSCIWLDCMPDGSVRWRQA